MLNTKMSQVAPEQVASSSPPEVSSSPNVNLAASGSGSNNLDDYHNLLDVYNGNKTLSEMSSSINYENITIPQLENLLDSSKKRYIQRPDVYSQFSKRLIENMTEIMKQLYKKNPEQFPEYENDAKISGAISDIQLEQARYKRPLVGGSKNKQKTLKNRRQRFNIRLV